MKFKLILSISLIILLLFSTFFLYSDRKELNSRVQEKEGKIQQLNYRVDSLKQQVQKLVIEVERNKKAAIVMAQQLQEVLLKQSR